VVIQKIEIDIPDIFHDVSLGPDPFLTINGQKCYTGGGGESLGDSGRGHGLGGGAKKSLMKSE